MAGENTVSSLNGLFKKVYASGLIDLLPDFALLQRRLEFSSAQKLGDVYSQPVNLSQEAGFTYNGENGAVASLNGPVAGVMKEATVRGSEMILRAQLSYMAVSRAAEQGEKAFKKATAWKLTDMTNAMRKRLEISIIHGQKPIGLVSGLASQVITLTAASWAGGIWAGSENAVIDVYPAGSNTVRQAGLVISAVDTDARTLTVTGTTTGIVATDEIYFKGVRTSGSAAFNEMAGLKKIITNTTTLFGIDANAYSLWKGTQYAVGGTLTMAKLQDALSKAVNRGLMGKVLVLVNPKVFGSLNADQAALRSYDVSYRGAKTETGSEALVYHYCNGSAEVLAHPFVMEGEALILPEDLVQRVGSVDMSFGLPGSDVEVFERVPGSNAIECQCVADQAVFIEKPAVCIFANGIS